MKQNTNKKRSYWGFFARIFALMLAAAILVGLVACWGFYQYDISMHQKESILRIEKLHDWLRDPENADATDAEIQIQLSFKTVVDDAYIDRGVVLYDMQTGKTYDSREITWSLVKVKEDNIDSLEALKGISGTPDFVETYLDNGAFRHNYVSTDLSVFEPFYQYMAKHPYSDYGIRINDVYVKGDHVIPGSGTMDLYANGREEPRESITLTPPEKVPEGYVHFVRKDADTIPDDAIAADIIFFLSVGSKQNSPALAEAHRMMETFQQQSPDKTGSSSLWEELTQVMVYRLRDVEGDANGERWRICTVTKYNFLLEHREHFLIFGTGLFVLLFLFALLIARIRYMRYAKEYELNEYRRRLTASLAHDLKSPLMAISGYAENLRENVHAEKRTSYADSILQNTQYMDRLIADVLDLAKLEQGTPLRKQSCDIPALAKETAAQLSGQIEEKHLTVSIDGTCTVPADPRMMAQALTNLIGNAVKFTPQGGRITVTCTEKNLTVCNDIAAPIPDAAQLIEPFIKGSDARDARSGSGMGLAIVKQICLLHGFRLTVSAEEQRFSADIRF